MDSRRIRPRKRPRYANGFGHSGTSSRGGATPIGDHVVLLGIDGLSRSFLEAPIVRESMPSLGQFLRRSSAGPLMSTLPAYTAPAWTTITTGVDPGRHGVFSFTDGKGRPISGATVETPRIWDYIGEAEGRSVVVNVPMTHPPRPIEGTLVSGMPAPPGMPFTSPRAIASKLEDFDYVVDVAVQVAGPERNTTLDRLARMTEARGRAVEWLARSQQWDLFAVVFVLPDRLGHPWWKHLVPGEAAYDSRLSEQVRRRARASLVALDNAIADLLAATPAGTDVVLCSDHGFGPLRADVFFDVVLAGHGLIETQRGSRLRGMVTRAGRSRIAQHAPAQLRSWVRSKTSGASHDSARAVWTGPPYESGVRLAEDDAALEDTVVELLRALTSPEGKAVVQAVHRRTDLYSGPNVEAAPHLVCEMTDPSISLHDGLHARHPWVSREALAWGTHAPEGIVAIAGAVQDDVRGRAADVASTVLALLGLEVEGLDGRSLVRPRDGRPARQLGAPADVATGAADVYSPDQEAAVLEHLRGLGYVD